MTKEQKEKALAFLKDMQECTYDGLEEIRTAIESLEQQPSEDCVSRQAVLDCLTATGLKKFDFILDSREKVNNLPPVTPTHGVCKDCVKGHKYKNITVATNRPDWCPLVEIEERKVGKILIYDKYRLPMYECLGCNHPVMKYWKYCPKCGNNIEECKNE